MNRFALLALGLVLVASLQMIACAEKGPVEIHYGQDQCEYCKMTIADKRFGTELVTSKGKAYKFDSIECLAAYRYTSSLSAENIQSMWITDFGYPGSFLDVDKAQIIASERQKSPMGMGLVAVATKQQAEKLIEVVGGMTLPWNEVINLVSTDWKLAK